MPRIRSDKGKRLASIILMLRASKSLTADDLASSLAVTVRTVYRDLDALASAGVPVRGTPGPSGGYELAENFPVDPLVYLQADPPPILAGGSSDAGNAIESTTRILANSMPPRLRDAVQRLSERFLFDTSAWFWEDTRLAHFPDLKQAVMDDLVIEIVYTGRGSSEIQDDVVDPYGLVWRQGHWYLFAWSHAGKRFDRHRLARILAVRATGRRFKRRARFHLTTAWAKQLAAFGRGGTRVRIRIDYPATKDFESFVWKNDQNIVKHADHWIVQMDVDSDEWLLPLVMSYGDKIRVLEPESLRNRVALALQSAMAAYAPPGLGIGSDPARSSSTGRPPRKTLLRGDHHD
jgi:predicted DNA-binding transcriptional regulator YafY